MLHGGKARPLEAGVFALPWGWLVPNCIITSSNSVYPASPRPDASKGYTRAWLGDQYTNQAQQKVQLKELLMGAAKPPSFRTPTFIRDMFDQSLDFILSNSWPDCLDVEFGENHISPGALLVRWKRMSKNERGLWIIGKLWNNTSILSSSNCTILEVPLGCTYARAVRKLKDDLRQDLLPES